MSDSWSYEETDDPLYADRRNFYKVEKWTGVGCRTIGGRLTFRCRWIFSRWPGVAYIVNESGGFFNLKPCASLLAKSPNFFSPPGRGCGTGYGTAARGPS
jgi:hypothetical protein